MSTIEVLSRSDAAVTTLLVLKRPKMDENGYPVREQVSFDVGKIATAMTKAFLAVEGEEVRDAAHVKAIVQHLTDRVVESFHRRPHAVLDIEDIQNQVILELMLAGEREVASAYVLYREKRRLEREAPKHAEAAHPRLRYLDAEKQYQPFVPDQWLDRIHRASLGLTDINAAAILKELERNLYDGVPLSEMEKALVMVARAFIEKEPNYNWLTARLLLQNLYGEGLRFLHLNAVFSHDAHAVYAESFIPYIERGVALSRLDERLLTQFDLHRLKAALLPERDLQFGYLGLQTLYDRYFIHEGGIRFELPQTFFMRVAMGLALNEDDPTARAIEFYELLSSFDFMSSTPTLFNSGTRRPQLSSCYLTTVPDDLDGIFGAIKDNALLSKYAGGLGNDWSNVRAMGSYIEGTNGQSLGVVPFLNVADATAVAVNQGGKRKGAVCAYLETWHLDIEEFLELRKNTGDDRRRTHDMNTANWIPDLFMERLEENGNWTLFSPNETPDLHDLYGDEFRAAYVAYEEKAAKGEIKQFKVIPALNLWRKMLSMLFETGHPWVTFKDPCNLRSPQQHAGVVHSSNLCTEITLNTSQDEIAVCNLGSVNLAQHIRNNGLDTEKLSRTIKTAIRMLDNVIDINYYSVPQAKRSNFKHRPIGLGLMGFQDALYQLDLHYTEEAAVDFADHSMETISYYALQSSSELAKERGVYESYAGSLWDQGILPIDSIELLKNTRRLPLEQDQTQRLDWDALRTHIQQHGMRNSNVLAIAPTATIANICGVTQSIEPTYQNLYVKSNLSGEFTIVNPYLVKALKAENLWDKVMVYDLKYYNGSVGKIDRIPQAIREKFATVFEIDAYWLIKAASRRQKWIDQAQSLNLYMAKPSGKKLDQLYRAAWRLGLKTTYYLRTLGATNPEKSTIHDRALNAVSSQPKVCAIDDPSCEACQ